MHTVSVPQPYHLLFFFIAASRRAMIKGQLVETIVGIVGETENLPCVLESGDRALVQWFKGENRINSKDNM